MVLLRNMTRSKRGKVQTIIEATKPSLIVGDQRGSQKWCIACISVLGFSAEFIKFWEAQQGKIVYKIERAIGALRGN
jgi:hypothetical protein